MYLRTLSSKFNHKTYFPYSIQHVNMKQLLFPEEGSGASSTTDLFGSNDIPTPVINSLGGNLHQVNDSQINKLINLKFNGQPVSLIRQLSYDLALKELELILLRKEKFQREQELLKMCNEYGNLSSLEIDQKLNSLKVDENVDKVLLGLIKHAINEDMKSEIPHDSIESEIIEDEATNKFGPVSTTPTRPAGWISDWFKEPYKRHSSSSLTLDKETMKTRDSRLSYSYLDSSLSSIPATENTSDTRIPVELDTINKMDIPKTPDISINASVDKYGFFNDMNEFADKSTLESSVGKEPESLSDERIVNNESKFSITETNPLEVKGTTNVRLVKPSIDKLKEIGQLHDAKNKQFEFSWDQFIKDLIKVYYKYADLNVQPQDINYHAAISGHEIFGAQGLNLIKLDKSQSKFGSNSNAPHEIGSLKTLRKLVSENGIPLKYRCNLWLELSGAKNLRVPGELHNLIKGAKTTTSDAVKSNIHQIDLDLHRTLPSNIYFNDLVNSQPGPNFYKLQNVLYAFVAYNSDIGYCQGMNKIVGNLLLGENKLTEEDIFWIFTAFVEDILPKYNGYNFFSIHSLPVIRVDQKIMRLHYFPRLLPKLNAHFSTLNLQIEYITLNWWLLLFTDGLPLEIWFKLFDNFLVTNVEITLITLSLSLFKIFEKYLLASQSCNDIYLVMKNFSTLKPSKIKIKYHELMAVNTTFERKITREDLHTLRKLYKD